MMTLRRLAAVVAVVAGLGPETLADSIDRRETFPAPAGAVTLSLDSEDRTLWPWTSADLSGRPSDPINLIVLGDADPRDVRQALMSLDGDRSALGFPPVAPFNCTWRDGIGVPETSWAEAEGWTGSAVGLECGDYGVLRVHLRLFRQGGMTLGGAHFELLIPGTTTHEVLSWEFAELFVQADLARSGFLLAPPEATPQINAAPTWRAIRWQVFNGVPASLRGLLGLPLANQASDVPIPNDGRATVLRLQHALEPERAHVRQDFIQSFDQVVPRPFCSAGPLDYVYVNGPLHFRFRVKTNPSGKYEARFSATGVLQVTPVNPLTGQPTGPTVSAVVPSRPDGPAHRSQLPATAVDTDDAGPEPAPGPRRRPLRPPRSGRRLRSHALKARVQTRRP
jgi:hypothetical protein